MPANASSPLSSDRLAELMIRYQQADREAVTELVQLASPILLRFLEHSRSTQAQAEAMLEECWRRIHDVRHTYRPGTPVLPWLFGIARQVRIDV